MKPCEECKWYGKEVDIHCIFCRGEYIDRWEPNEEALIHDKVEIGEDDDQTIL